MNTRKEYWNLILTAALVLGVLYTALSFLGYVCYGMPAIDWIMSIAGIGVILWSLVYYGRKVAVLKDVDGVGFSYGQGFGFSMLVLVMSGVIIGIGQWLLQNVVDPEFYEAIAKEAMRQSLEMLGSAATDQQIEMTLKTQEMLRNPLWLVFGTMFSMSLMGGLVALAAAAIIKRKPSIVDKES